MTMTWFTWGKKEEKETLMKRYERIKKEIESYDEDDEQEVKASNDVYSLLNSMLFGDSLIYSFAYLRKLALTEKLDREDLIVTDPQNKEDRLRSFQSRCSKTINAQDVFQFVHANLDRFNDDEELNSDLTVHALLSLSKSNDAYLSTFDDQFDETSLVYGICVNRGLKRITISFRGSVTESNNWNHNLQVGLSEMNTPEKVAKLGFSEEKKIQVHTGFKTYVFQEKYDPENPGKQKYDEIKKDILYLYDEDGCEGYNIYVTGHSLGAAVSTLVAFELAASREVEKRLGENPVVNINFASPYLGGKSFNEAFRVSFCIKAPVLVIFVSLLLCVKVLT